MRAYKHAYKTLANTSSNSMFKQQQQHSRYGEYEEQQSQSQCRIPQDVHSTCYLDGSTLAHALTTQRCCVYIITLLYIAAPTNRNDCKQVVLAAAQTDTFIAGVGI
eukprot:1947-Heterococcus_DN1.PRE.2